MYVSATQKPTLIDDARSLFHNRSAIAGPRYRVGCGFITVVIASVARFAAARSGAVGASDSARGVVCQEKPKRSSHQPGSVSGLAQCAAV